MSGVIVNRTPTIVVGGVQQYFVSYALRVLDANGDEVSTVPVPSDRPELLGAIAWNIRQSLREGFTLDFDGESNQSQAMTYFGRGEA